MFKMTKNISNHGIIPNKTHEFYFLNKYIINLDTLIPCRILSGLRSKYSKYKVFCQIEIKVDNQLSDKIKQIEKNCRNILSCLGITKKIITMVRKNKMFIRFHRKDWYQNSGYIYGNMIEVPYFKLKSGEVKVGEYMRNCSLHIDSILIKKKSGRLITYLNFQ